MLPTRSSLCALVVRKMWKPMNIPKFAVSSWALLFTIIPGFLCAIDLKVHQEGTRRFQLVTRRRLIIYIAVVATDFKILKAKAATSRYGVSSETLDSTAITSLGVISMPLFSRQCRIFAYSRKPVPSVSAALNASMRAASTCSSPFPLCLRDSTNAPQMVAQAPLSGSKGKRLFKLLAHARSDVAAKMVSSARGLTQTTRLACQSSGGVRAASQRRACCGSSWQRGARRPRSLSSRCRHTLPRLR